MPAQLLLGEDQLAVHRHLEHPAGGLYQLHRDAFERSFYLGRQTGGPWLVASNTAVFDGYLHGPSPVRSMKLAVRKLQQGRHGRLQFPRPFTTIDAAQTKTQRW